MVKARTVEKDQEQYEKTITELNGRAAKFYKSSITKLFRSRKISKSWQLPHSQLILRLPQYVLPCLNCFYFQANLNLIDSLKFAQYWK